MAWALEARHGSSAQAIQSDHHPRTASAPQSKPQTIEADASPNGKQFQTLGNNTTTTLADPAAHETRMPSKSKLPEARRRQESRMTPGAQLPANSQPQKISIVQSLIVLNARFRKHMPCTFFGCMVLFSDKFCKKFCTPKAGMKLAVSTCSCRAWHLNDKAAMCSK